MAQRLIVKGLKQKIGPPEQLIAVIKISDFSTYLITHKHEHLNRIKESIYSVPLSLFDGTGYDSFSKLVNECTVSSPTETVIMMSYKVTPSLEHIQKTLDLLDNGFGFVALYRFGFFGFSKELFRRIGFLDERFIKGGFEDSDFYIRLCEANIAAYITTEIPFLQIPSSWGDYTPAYHFFQKKWGVTHPGASDVRRILPEEKYNYDLGESVPCEWKPWTESSITGYNPNKYKLIR